MIKHIINTFIVIAACLGLAAFILVLVKKQNCQTKSKKDNFGISVWNGAECSEPSSSGGGYCEHGDDCC
jgi:hypothetical protein